MEYTSAPLLNPGPRSSPATAAPQTREPAEQFQFRAVPEEEGTQIHPALLPANQRMQQMRRI